MADSAAVARAALAAVVLLIILNAAHAAEEAAWTAECGKCNKDCVAGCELDVPKSCRDRCGGIPVCMAVCKSDIPTDIIRCSDGCYRGTCAMPLLMKCPEDATKLCKACGDACDGSCSGSDDGDCKAACFSDKCVSGSGCPPSSPPS